METTKKQITDFLNKCEELKNCKFIMATTKIKDLLKSIVNSAELYELFNTVAANFDYIAAKQQCFIEADSPYGHSSVALPDTVGDRLAFIFCLLVEFDRNDINFNAFLQKYYPKDGSYYASYHLFCDEVIGSLEAIVCDIFQKELSEPVPEQAVLPPVTEEEPPRLNNSKPSAQVSSAIAAIRMLIDSEKQWVEDSSLARDEKDEGISILNSLSAAVGEGDAKLIKSLTCGYNYFVMYNVYVSETLSMLFEALGEYISSL